MSQLAQEQNSINLGQGFPDFDPDETLVDNVTQAMKAGHNQYPPMTGMPELRHAIGDKVKNLYGHQYDATSEITVTSGASQALMASILAFVHPGDEVIVIEPVYDLYIPAITLAGGHPVIVPMLAPAESDGRYRIDWGRVRDAITTKTRLLILNFPHNPTCINLLEEDLDALEDIVQKTGITVLSDEVYEHIVFNGDSHRSVCSRRAIADNSVVISSFGKTFHVTGWKVGYCCAPAKLMKEIRKVHQFDVFTVVRPMQVALANYLQDPQKYLNLSSFYQKKHDRLYEGLKTTRLKPVRSEGTFFLLASYSEISDMPELEFTRWLTMEKGVTAIPLSAFYQQPDKAESNHGLIRFCFAKQDHTLNEAVSRLQSL